MSASTTTDLAVAAREDASKFWLGHGDQQKGAARLAENRMLAAMLDSPVETERSHKRNRGTAYAAGDPIAKEILQKLLNCLPFGWEHRGLLEPTS